MSSAIPTPSALRGRAGPARATRARPVAVPGIRLPSRPAGITFGAGTLTGLVVTGLGGPAIQAGLIGTGGLLVILAVAGAAWCRRATPGSALALGLMCWLLVDGLVENRDGQLGWHGTTDLRIGAVLLLATGGIAIVRRLTMTRTRAG
jgi:hypothetical protein